MEHYDVIVEAKDLQGYVTALYLASRRRRVALIENVKQLPDVHAFDLTLGGLEQAGLLQRYWHSVLDEDHFPFEGKAQHTIQWVDAQGIKRVMPREHHALKIYFIRYYARHHEAISRFFKQCEAWYEDFVYWENERLRGRPTLMSKAQIETYQQSLDALLSRFFEDEALKQAFNIFSEHQALALHEIDAWAYLLSFFNRVFETPYRLIKPLEALIERLRKLCDAQGITRVEGVPKVWRQESDHTMTVMLEDDQTLLGRMAVSVAKETYEKTALKHMVVTLNEGYTSPLFKQELRIVSQKDVPWIRFIPLSDDEGKPITNQMLVQAKTTLSSEALVTWIGRYAKDFPSHMAQAKDVSLGELSVFKPKKDRSLEALAQDERGETWMLSSQHLSVPKDHYAQAGLFGRMRLAILLAEQVHERLYKKVMHQSRQPETALMGRLLFAYQEGSYAYRTRLKLDFGKSDVIIIFDDEARFYGGEKAPDITLNLDYETFETITHERPTLEDALSRLSHEEDTEELRRFLKAFQLDQPHPIPSYEPYKKPWGMALFVVISILLSSHFVTSLWVLSPWVSWAFSAAILALGIGVKLSLKTSLVWPIWVVFALIVEGTLVFILNQTLAAHMSILAVVLIGYLFTKKNVLWRLWYRDRMRYDAASPFFIKLTHGLSWLWALAFLAVSIISWLVPLPNTLLALYVLLVMLFVTFRYEPLFLASKTREMRR